MFGEAEGRRRLADRCGHWSRWRHFPCTV